MATTMEKLKICAHGSLSGRTENCVDLKRMGGQKTADRPTSRRFNFILVWFLLLVFCVAAWFWVITGVSAHLAYLK